MQKWGHLSGYHAYSRSNDHENVKSCSSSFVFFADDSKASLTVWAKCLGTSERFYVVLSENVMDCWILIVTSKMSILENARHLPKSWLFCAAIVKKKNKTPSILDILMTITLEAKKTNDPIFLISHLSSIRCHIYIFTFCISRP